MYVCLCAFAKCVLFQNVEFKMQNVNQSHHTEHLSHMQIGAHSGLCGLHANANINDGMSKMDEANHFKY